MLVFFCFCLLEHFPLLFVFNLLSYYAMGFSKLNQVKRDYAFLWQNNLTTKVLSTIFFNEELYIIKIYCNFFTTN